MGRFNFKQHTEDNYEVSPSQAKKWLEQNKANRSVNKAKVKQLSEKEQKQLIFSATKRFAKAKKEEVLKLEIEAIKKENAWSAQKGIGCKPFDDA